MTTKKRTIANDHIEGLLKGFREYRTGESGVAEKTARENATHIRNFYSTFSPEWEKEQALFRTWIKACRNPSDLRNQRIISLRTFWDWAEKKKGRRAQTNWATEFRIKKVRRVPKIPAREEVQRVIGVLDDLMRETLKNKNVRWAKKWKTIRNCVVVILMASTGIRARELLQLHPDSFDLGQGQIFIPAEIAKNRQERESDIPNIEYLLALLREMKNFHAALAARGEFDASSPLFAGLGRGTLHVDGGKAINTGSISSWAKKLYEEHGIKITGLHDFRRYYATDYILGCYERDEKPDVLRLKDALGHTDLSVTQTYINEVLAKVKRRNLNDYEPGFTALALVKDDPGETGSDKLIEFPSFELPEKEPACS
jgi:integrase